MLDLHVDPVETLSDPRETYHSGAGENAAPGPSGGQHGASAPPAAAHRREWRWLADERMWQALLPALYPERIGKHEKIIPTRLTDKAVDDSGVPRMSGELVAYLDEDQETEEAQWWRALYAWSPLKCEFYWSYLRVKYAGHGPGTRGAVSNAQMALLGRAFGRGESTVRGWLAAVYEQLNATVGAALVRNITQRQHKEG